MKELSIFIDESGDFGETDNTSPYYLVTMVFHNQANSISQHVLDLENALERHGYNNFLIHAGPIIRREREYLTMNIDERRTIFFKMLAFYKHAPIKHSTIIVNKRETSGIFQLTARLSKQLNSIIQTNLTYFQSFDKVIVYYDNGQQQLNLIINTILNTALNDVDFRKATPSQYRLLQVADFVCTLELLKLKRAEKRLSKSEEAFFYKPNELKKTFIKALDEKRL